MFALPFDHLFEDTTPLLALLRELRTVERQSELANLAGTTRGYLYQLAGGHRSPSATLALAIAKASEQLRRKYGTIEVSMEELAQPKTRFARNGAQA